MIIFLCELIFFHLNFSALGEWEIYDPEHRQLETSELDLDQQTTSTSLVIQPVPEITQTNVRTLNANDSNVTHYAVNRTQK